MTKKREQGRAKEKRNRKEKLKEGNSKRVFKRKRKVEGEVER